LYEHRSFELPHKTYLPDFYVKGGEFLNLSAPFWLEVKGGDPTETELESCYQLAVATRERVCLVYRGPQTSGGRAWMFDPGPRRWQLLHANAAVHRNGNRAAYLFKGGDDKKIAADAREIDEVEAQYGVGHSIRDSLKRSPKLWAGFELPEWVHKRRPWRHPPSFEVNNAWARQPSLAELLSVKADDIT
jgi:hypothetical protein